MWKLREIAFSQFAIKYEERIFLQIILLYFIFLTELQNKYLKFNWIENAFMRFKYYRDASQQTKQAERVNWTNETRHLLYLLVKISMGVICRYWHLKNFNLWKLKRGWQWCMNLLKSFTKRISCLLEKSALVIFHKQCDRLFFKTILVFLTFLIWFYAKCFSFIIYFEDVHN